MLDKVIIRDLVARGIIGINDSERINTQEILINLTLYTNLETAGKTDDIIDCINYSTLSKKIIRHAETANRLTVEALAEDLAQICLEDTRVMRVNVRVEKPGAVRYARAVGVEIEREQAT